MAITHCDRLTADGELDCSAKTRSAIAVSLFHFTSPSCVEPTTALDDDQRDDEVMGRMVSPLRQSNEHSALSLSTLSMGE